MSAGRSGLAGNATIYFGANVLNAAIPFLLLPVLTRVLTTAEYGMVAMFGLLVSVLLALSGLSVHNAVLIRFFQIDAESHAKYVGACLAILGVSTISIALIVTVLREWVIWATSLPLTWALLAVVVASCKVLILVRLKIYQAQGHAFKYGTFQMVQTAANIALSILFVVALAWGWQGRAGATVLVVVAAGAVAMSQLRRGSLVDAGFQAGQVKDALRFGVPLIPHTVGAFLTFAIDRLIINNVLGLHHVGIYMVGLQFGMILGLFVESFKKAYEPWLFERLQSASISAHRQIVGYTYVYFVVALAIAVVLSALMKMILPLVVGTEFLDAGALILYVALGFAFKGMYYMVSGYIFFSGQTKYLAYVTIFTGLLNIPLTYFMLQLNGVVGAAQAFMLTQAIGFAGTWGLSIRVFEMPWLRPALGTAFPAVVAGGTRKK